MKTEQVMALAEDYASDSGDNYYRTATDARYKSLQDAVEQLVQERDELKNQLDGANSGWYDKLLEATLESDKLAAENKVLRDAAQAGLDALIASLDYLSSHTRTGVEIMEAIQQLQAALEKT